MAEEIKKKITYCLKRLSPPLAGVTQWIECQPASQRITSLIPHQGTCLGCRPGPQSGAHERQPQTDVSPPLSFPSPFSKNKQIKSF